MGATRRPSGSKKKQKKKPPALGRRTAAGKEHRGGGTSSCDEMINSALIVFMVACAVAVVWRLNQVFGGAAVPAHRMPRRPSAAASDAGSRHGDRQSFKILERRPSAEPHRVFDHNIDLSHLSALRPLAKSELGVDIPNIYHKPWDVNITAAELGRGFYAGGVDEQLSPFRENGGVSEAITLRMAENPTGSYVHYQIISGKLYRQRKCYPFVDRCAGIEHFLVDIAENAPELRGLALEFVVNIRDQPQQKAPRLPVFSFSVQQEHIELMYPAWAFWQGGPRVSAVKTWRWDAMREQMQAAADATPWEERTEKAFFRGSRTCPYELPCPRDPWVRITAGLSGEPQSGPEVADAGYTKHMVPEINNAVLSQGLEFAASVPLEEHCKWKYLLNFDGVAASFRLKNILLCGSVVLNAGLHWQEFFYRKLIPWVHYVPVRHDGSDAVQVVQFLQRHDNIARVIARNGRSFVASHLRMEDIRQYWVDILREYASLLAYTPQRKAGFKHIKPRRSPRQSQRKGSL